MEERGKLKILDGASLYTVQFRQPPTPYSGLGNEQKASPYNVTLGLFWRSLGDL